LIQAIADSFFKVFMGRAGSVTKGKFKEGAIMNEKPLEECSDRISRACSATQEGAEARVISIEASFGRGFAGLQLVGNVGQIVEDGKERARMAIERLNMAIPAKRLLISFSPGDLKVEGNHFDLGMAVVMATLIRPNLPKINPSSWVFAAEIGLNGELRPVPGAVGHGVAAMAGGMCGVVIAKENLPELKALEGVSADSGRKLVYIAFSNLMEVIEWLWTGELNFELSLRDDAFSEIKQSEVFPNFDDMELTPEVQLAAEVAAIGMHSMILRGVPGSGKSMFAKRLVTLLPALTSEEHLTALQIHSASSDKISSRILSGFPPYRAPHHFASGAAILGAGVKPGEVALASGGILFLDEFPEFRRDVIEALREPLESGEVQVSRAQSKRVWRAKMMLVAAANNCPCGWRGSSKRKCMCPENRVSAYRQRLSGPILICQSEVNRWLDFYQKCKGQLRQLLRKCSKTFCRLESFPSKEIKKLAVN
jgi:magnesium chelatase family protein